MKTMEKPKLSPVLRLYPLCDHWNLSNFTYLLAHLYFSSVSLCILLRRLQNLRFFLRIVKSSTYFHLLPSLHLGFPNSSVGKESASNSGDPGSIPGLGRSAGEGTGCLLRHAGLENFMDCIVHSITKSWTLPSDFHFHFFTVEDYSGDTW